MPHIAELIAKMRPGIKEDRIVLAIDDELIAILQTTILLKVELGIDLDGVASRIPIFKTQK